MSIAYLNLVEKNFSVNEQDQVIDSIFKQYERVVIESIVTSFGLDFLVNDKHGGDVDTVHNVRQIGIDSQMEYKNKNNETAYNNRGNYNQGRYHSDPRFTTKKSQAKRSFNEKGTLITDAYTGKDLKYTKASTVPRDERLELDHVVECKGAHDDRGRVLSGLSGIDLANSEENFAWTNKSLNASMGSWARHKNDKWRKEHGCDAPLSEVDMKAYLKEHPDIDSETRQRMLNQYEKSRKAYDAKINMAYYTSSVFIKDTAKAAGKVGVLMGVRQALGLVFTEIWFAVKAEFQKLNDKFKVSELFNSIGNGIKCGIANAKEKFGDIIRKFLDGALAGTLASLTSTLTNIFFTTAKSVVRIIRQTWASIVEAIKILLFNPDGLLFGDRIKAAAKILAVGASVVAGTMVSEMIATSGLGTIPVVGEIVQTFCGTLVTGILSCSLLYILDRSEHVQSIVNFLNKIPTLDSVVNHYKEQARRLSEYCAQLQSIDLETFIKETAMFQDIASQLNYAEQTDEEMQNYLLSMYKKHNISLPWQGDFDSFMCDKNNKLVFC